jgi:hypothetical protein
MLVDILHLHSACLLADSRLHRSRIEIDRALAICSSDQLAVVACWPELWKARSRVQEVRGYASFAHQGGQSSCARTRLRKAAYFRLNLIGNR